MGLLDGKVAVVTGVANNYSIAWAIAKKFKEEGADIIFTYQGERVKERVEKLVSEYNPKLLIDLDVTDKAQVENFGKQIIDTYGKVDILVHSIAYAPAEALQCEFNATSKEAFELSNDISAYSLISLSNALLPAFEAAGGGSILYMTYLGAERAISTYKVMGVNKATLEASGMYLAQDLGKRNIRVNGISAGPIKTLAAKGISKFSDLQKQAEALHPLQGTLKSEDVAGTALYLASDLSKCVTGEIIHVDKGFHCVAG